MPLRKRIGIMGVGGWPLECLAGLEPASLRYATQRDTSYTIGTISRDCGLSVDSWRVYSTLSTFASLRLYNTTLFSPKTCKVYKNKRPLLAARHLRYFF